MYADLIMMGQWWFCIRRSGPFFPLLFLPGLWAELGGWKDQNRAVVAVRGSVVLFVGPEAGVRGRLGEMIGRPFLSGSAAWGFGKT